MNLLDPLVWSSTVWQFCLGKNAFLNLSWISMLWCCYCMLCYGSILSFGLQTLRLIQLSQYLWLFWKFELGQGAFFWLLMFSFPVLQVFLHRSYLSVQPQGLWLCAVIFQEFLCLLAARVTKLVPQSPSGSAQIVCTVGEIYAYLCIKRLLLFGSKLPLPF